MWLLLGKQKNYETTARQVTGQLILTFVYDGCSVRSTLRDLGILSELETKNDTFQDEILRY